MSNVLGVIASVIKVSSIFIELTGVLVHENKKNR